MTPNDWLQVAIECQRIARQKLEAAEAMETNASPGPAWTVNMTVAGVLISLSSIATKLGQPK